MSRAKVTAEVLGHAQRQLLEVYGRLADLAAQLDQGDDDRAKDELCGVLATVRRVELDVNEAATNVRADLAEGVDEVREMFGDIDRRRSAAAVKAGAS